MDILEKAIESIKEIGLTNNDLTRYGDGFEKAIELCLFSLRELNKQAQAEQLNIHDVSESVCVCKYPVRVAGDRLLEPYCGKCFKDFKQTVC